MSNYKNILLLGAGGHCLSVLDSLMELAWYDKIGVVDKNYSSENAGNCNPCLEKFMVGDDSDLPRLFSEGYTNAFITVGSIGNTSSRRKLYLLLKQIGYQMPNIIDCNGVVSKNASLGEGIYVGKNAVINAFSEVGNCAILNTSSTIEHECKIGDFVHIAPGCTLCGNVQVEEDTHIGAGSVIKQGIHIGKNTMIGMGSVVLGDIKSGVTAFGSPCKEVKS
ncbi:MAG TPA: acetyltransferase [Mobilitalea sp.]|nr:acetyltransferase [Mobilitalea sp.]